MWKRSQLFHKHHLTYHILTAYQNCVLPQKSKAKGTSKFPLDLATQVRHVCTISRRELTVVTEAIYIPGDNIDIKPDKARRNMSEEDSDHGSEELEEPDEEEWLKECIEKLHITQE